MLLKWDNPEGLDPYAVFPRVYSYSQIETFRRCQALYRHRYLRRIIRRKRESYYVWGEAYHAFLESWYTHKNMDLALKAIQDVFDAVDYSMASEADVDKLKVQRAQVLGIAESYPGIYGDDNWSDLMTEKQLTVQIKTPSRVVGYTGKVDMLVKDEQGWWVFETKTAAYGSVNSDFYQALGFDGQVVGYCVLAEVALGLEIQGVIYNVIQKPTIRPKKRPVESLEAYRQRVKDEYVVNAAGKEYMVRYPYAVPDYTKKEWLTDLVTSVRECDEKWVGQTRIWPKTTTACRAKFGVCAMAEACNAGACSDTTKYNKILYTRKPKRETNGQQDG